MIKVYIILISNLMLFTYTTMASSPDAWISHYKGQSIGQLRIGYQNTILNYSCIELTLCQRKVYNFLQNPLNLLKIT